MSHLIFIFVMLDSENFPSAIYPICMRLIFGSRDFGYIGNYTHILCKGQAPRFVIRFHFMVEPQPISASFDDAVPQSRARDIAQ